MPVQVSMPLEEYNELKKYKDEFEKYKAGVKSAYKIEAENNLNKYDKLVEDLRLEFEAKIVSLSENKTHALVFVSDIAYYSNNRFPTLDSTTHFLYKLVPVKQVNWWIKRIIKTFK